LPGIYGPGRSALERVTEGKAHRIDLTDQIFSRIHVDDILSGVIAGFAGPAGAYNLADDLPCSQNLVIEAACDLLGLPHPPLQSLGEANLSRMALDFYAENRRVSNVKAKRLLGWRPAYPTYQAGLRALSATTKPASASIQPATASSDQ
jgi:nucleoside-diphosphate-sugar epimerase